MPPWSKFFLTVLALDESYCSVETILKGLIIHNSWTFLNLKETETIVLGSVHLSSDSGLCLDSSPSIEDLFLKITSKQRLASTWYSWPFSPEMNCYINTFGNCISGSIDQGLPSCSNASNTVHPPSSALNLIRVLTSSNIQTLESTLQTELGDNFVDASTCLTITDVATYGAALALDAFYSSQNISRAFCDVPPAVSVLIHSNSTCEASAIASIDTFLNQPWTFPVVSPMLPDICYISVPVVVEVTDLTDGLLSHDPQTNQWTFPASSSPIPPPPAFMSIPQTLETCEPYRGNSVDCSTQDMWACDSVEGCFADWENSVCADTPPGFYSTSMSLVSECNPIPLNHHYVGLAWTNPHCPTKCIYPSEYLVDNDCTAIPSLGQYVGVCDDDNSLHSCTTSRGEGLVSFTTTGTCDGAFLKYLLLSRASNIICVWIHIGEHSAELRLFGQVADFWELRLLPSGDLQFVSTILDVRTSSPPSDLNHPSWRLFSFDGSNLYLDGYRIVFPRNFSIAINASDHVFYGPSSSAAGFAMMGPFDIPLIDLSAGNAASELFELLPVPPGYVRQGSTRPGPELEIYPQPATSTSTETIFNNAIQPFTTTSTETIYWDGTEPNGTTPAQTIYKDGTEAFTISSTETIFWDATETILNDATQPFTATSTETIYRDGTEAFTISSTETIYRDGTEPINTTSAGAIVRYTTEASIAPSAETISEANDATTTTDPPDSSAAPGADLDIIQLNASTISADLDVPSIAPGSTSTEPSLVRETSTTPHASQNDFQNFAIQETAVTTALMSTSDYVSSDPSSFSTAYDMATNENGYTESLPSTSEPSTPLSSYETTSASITSGNHTSTNDKTADIAISITSFPETSSASLEFPSIQVFLTPDEVTTTPDLIGSQSEQQPIQFTPIPPVNPSFTSANLQSRSPLFSPETATAPNTMSSTMASTNAFAEPAGSPHSDASLASQDPDHNIIPETSASFRSRDTEEIVLIGSATGIAVAAVILLATTITCLYRRRTTQPIISRNS